MAIPPELIDAAMAAFRERLLGAAADMTDARNPMAFCDAERTIQALTLELAAEMTRELLQGVSDDPNRRAVALAFVREKAASRGIQVLAQRARKTKIRTLGGQLIEVVTPYAVAKPRAGSPLEKRGSQGTGVYPVLDQIGITGRSTPALRLLVSRMVCEANSVQSARELMAASGVRLGHKTALRLTYSVCGDGLRARKRAMKAQKSGNDDGEFAGRRVVATVDGGRVNIRRRVAGRPKKGGRKRFETEWREPKILTLYVLGEDGKRDRSVPSVIDGTLGDADAVFDLLRYHLLRMGAHRASHVTLVADAAKWIWRRRSQELRKALKLPKECFTEIVDYYHAVQRLGDFAKARLRWPDDFRQDWLADQKRRLKAGLIEEIEAVFRVIESIEKDDLTTERAYWARHRERLRFADFRARGLPNGSGAVESAVRRVINLRMKGASIFWTEEHAEGILHLRAHAKSGRWSELESNVLDTTGWRPITRQPRKVA
jgi:hypothetical protein